MLTQTLFQAVVVSVGALGTAAAALAYFRRVRLDRPAIGAFNSRDLVILAVFIVVLPILYLAVPGPVLTGFLVLTFSSAMAIGLRPILPTRYRRVIVPVLIGAEIVVTYTMLGAPHGLQLYWVLTSVIVLVAATGVSNLYVQGGLRLRQIAWFAVFLAAYDAFFSTVVPLTPQLAAAFEGRPLNASIGWAAGPYSANIGLGDLLVYGLFVIAAYKAFDRRGATWAFATVFVFGALAPSVAPLVVSHFDQGADGIVIPAQLFFGPAAFAVTALLYRNHPERTTAQWLAEQAVGQQGPAPVVAGRPVEPPVPVPVPVAAH
ncbi:MAG: hypothetical protein QOI99_1251 [Actinomycetota bacterium]|nr:hypothetical protein [Actinomycetota bacterium]